MMTVLHLWWIWLAIGICLAIVEILAPGFIFLGFAIGAVIVAGLIAILPAQSISLPMILLIFSILSLCAWLVLRRSFKSPKGQVKTFEHDINN